MIFFIRPTKSLSPNIPGPRKSPANPIYYTVALVRMDDSPIWAFQCTSRISKIYGKLFYVRDKFAFPYLDDVLVYSDDFDSHIVM